MKISVLSVIAVLLLGALPVQSQVVFEETGIKAVFQKAREENKLVFIDCYTSWCGPCKKMLKEVFSRKDIGEYMNTRFVNYKQDMEQEEGKELAGKYGVEVYPTFFILDAAGEVRHKNGRRHDCRGVFETGAAGEWRKFVIRFQSPLPARRTESAIYDRIYRIAFGCLYERRYAKSVA